jgi:Domain of unknown function (DUF5753)
MDLNYSVLSPWMKTLTRDNAPNLIAVLDEMVISRIVGSPAVMASQIQQLLATIHACSLSSPQLIQKTNAPRSGNLG